MLHRDDKLDDMLGQKVKIHFTDGDVIIGNLTYNERIGCYGLTNCIDDKRGFMRNDTHFRKSHIKKIARPLI